MPERTDPPILVLIDAKLKFGLRDAVVVRDRARHGDGGLAGDRRPDAAELRLHDGRMIENSIDQKPNRFDARDAVSVLQLNPHAAVGGDRDRQTSESAPRLRSAFPGVPADDVRLGLFGIGLGCHQERDRRLQSVRR